MNDRIEKLIAKSKLENLDGFAQYEVDAIYNLAELIVLECMEVSLKYSHRDDDMGAIIARQIKQHFGVE